jgi:hypothetical protein
MKDTKDTVEKITCDAILQNPVEIEALGKKYHVAPPSIGTLIEVSKYISQMPAIDVTDDEKAILQALREAKNCEFLADIIAILILGKKNLITEKKYLFGIFSRKVNNQKKLADEILLSMSTDEVNELMISILKMLKVDFFLSILIFLRDVNLLKKTTANETTASGQQ